MIKDTEITNKKLFKLIDTDYKLYNKIYQEYISIILDCGYNITEQDSLNFLKTFFNQIKKGECN